MNLGFSTDTLLRFGVSYSDNDFFDDAWRFRTDLRLRIAAAGPDGQRRAPARPQRLDKCIFRAPCCAPTSRTCRRTNGRWSPSGAGSTNTASPRSASSGRPSGRSRGGAPAQQRVRDAVRLPAHLAFGRRPALADPRLDAARERGRRAAWHLVAVVRAVDGIRAPCTCRCRRATTCASARTPAGSSPTPPRTSRSVSCSAPAATPRCAATNTRASASRTPATPSSAAATSASARPSTCAGSARAGASPVRRRGQRDRRPAATSTSHSVTDSACACAAPSAPSGSTSPTARKRARVRLHFSLGVRF